MATTHIKTLRSGKGRSVALALKDIIDYVTNPLKTNNGELISSYECDSRTADMEFLLTKQQYTALTGREQKRGGVIAYHLRQSFKPGEVTPEEANRIGHELAMRFTKGRNAFVVCTHTDKPHTHNHIIFNSTNLCATRKFRDFYFSALALRRLNDIICLENGLSIIENPKISQGKTYGRPIFGDDYSKRQPTFKQRLMDTIDTALEQRPATFEKFLDMLRELGCTVLVDRKHLRLLAPPVDGLPNQVKPTRCDNLKGDYAVAAIMERIAKGRIVGGGTSLTHAASPIGESRKPSLLIDIQAKLQQGKGAGYERFAKIHNLKQMAQTLIYLQEQGLDDYELLKEKSSAASARFNKISSRIRELDAELTANAELQKQIVTYSKTRKTYVEYRKAGYSKKFKALHETDIILHQAAKKYFDELGYDKDKRLPTIATLREEYAVMLNEKKQAYRGYRQAKSDMRSLLIAKSNIDSILNIAERPHSNIEKTAQCQQLNRDSETQ